MNFQRSTKSWPIIRISAVPSCPRDAESVQGKRRDSPGLRNDVSPPKNTQWGEGSSGVSPPEVPALLYSCIIIVPQSAEENCFHKQGFYALKNLNTST